MASTTDGKVHNIEAPGEIAKLVKLAKSSDSARAVAEEKALVEKIVIGPSPGSEPKSWDDAALGELSEVDWATFPNLTHLYLWSIEHLTAIKGFPEGLQCLDVRGCTGLVRLPKLPAVLETLDLGGCAALSTIPTPTGKQLRRVYFDGCGAITNADGNRNLGRLLEHSPFIEELSLVDCTWLTYLELPWCEENEPRPGQALRKLVLRGCRALDKLSPLERHPRLQHLDLNGCERLTAISGLTVGESDGGRPLGIQTLYTANCPKLKEYRRTAASKHVLDIRATHRSPNPTINVATQFRALHELAETVTEFRMSKILLLGSGRCGKTTLARALRWHDFSPEERAAKRADKTVFPVPDPPGIPSTPDIDFMQWEVDFGDGEQGAKAPRGTLHVWDFGGQEIYHKTHRLFAAEGAIFIVAVTTETEQQGRARAEEERANDPKYKLLLRDWNLYREVSYWLDYVASAKNLPPSELRGEGTTEIKIAVTSPEEMGEELFRQAGRYRDQVIQGHIPRLHVRVCRNDPVTSIRDLRAWVGAAIAGAADQLGVRIPKVYADISDWVVQTVGTDETRKPLSWDSWRDEVVRRLPADLHFSERSKTDIAVAVAEYLHACGRLFRICGRGGIEQVVLDQERFVKLLYAIITPSEAGVRMRLQAHTAVPVETATMRETIRSIDFIDDDTIPTLLAMMDACDLLVDIGGDRWAALHPELLPALDDDTEKALYETWRDVARGDPLNPSSWGNWSVTLHGRPSELLLGESHFRKVCAWLARGMDDAIPRRLWPADDDSAEKRTPRFRHGAAADWSHRADCRLWRGGMQVTMRRPDDGGSATPSAVVVRIEWHHHTKDDPGSQPIRLFSGSIFLQVLSTAADSHAQALIEMMVADDGPLPEFRDKLELGDRSSPDVPADKRWCPRGSGQPGWTTKDGPTGPGMPWDVAISYRRDQKELVEKLVRALEVENLNVYHDLEDTRIYPRPDKPQGSNLEEIYDHLRRARVLIVIPSESYFETPSLAGEKAVNFYCPVELAEAIETVVTESRPATRLLWVAPAGAVKREELGSEGAAVIKQYEAAFRAAELHTAPTEIESRQYRAVRWVDEGRLQRFKDMAGWGQHNYIDVHVDAGEPDLAAIVQRVRQVLDSR